jgi:2-hydroxychromene-2-carboxylate isomerase
LAPAPEVRFFYGLGSRYSYLASTRIERLQADTGCRMRWRPLFSGDLFRARGADPFAGPPVSGQYDWAYRRFDAECWADYYGVPYREPDDVRFDPRRLALASTAASRLGAAEAFSRGLFQALFVNGESPLDDAVCLRLAGEIGLDPEIFAAALDDPETAAALAATVAEALAAGVFGVPSFVVAGRVYFGNDRLPILRHMLLKASRPGPTAAATSCDCAIPGEPP